MAKKTNLSKALESQAVAGAFWKSISERKRHGMPLPSDDELTRQLTAFPSMDALLNAKGGYRPSLTKKNEETMRLADAYDAYQHARGDSRRAFRG